MGETKKQATARSRRERRKEIEHFVAITRRDWSLNRDCYSEWAVNGIQQISYLIADDLGLHGYVVLPILDDDGRADGIALRPPWGDSDDQYVVPDAGFEKNATATERKKLVNFFLRLRDEYDADPLATAIGLLVQARQRQ